MDIISEFADVNDFDGHMEVVMSRVGHVLVQAGHGTYMPTTLEMMSETYSIMVDIASSCEKTALASSNPAQRALTFNCVSFLLHKSATWHRLPEFDKELFTGERGSKLR